VDGPPCRYCQHLFQHSRLRPRQFACSRSDGQRQRRRDCHRRKIETDPEYARVVRDSHSKWRDAHPDCQKNYRQTQAEAARRNRQRQRDQKRRLQKPVKNNLALDLKRSPAQVWLVGPAALTAAGFAASDEVRGQERLGGFMLRRRESASTAPWPCRLGRHAGGHLPPQWLGAEAH
jgi:hypothetical protein